MFWEFYQEGRISGANRTAGRAERAAARATEQSLQLQEKLESQIESLALTCQALFEILEKKVGITKDELEAKMEEIDLRDGVQDGRITPSAKVCSQCGRRTSRSRSHCLYCGGIAEEK